MMELLVGVFKDSGSVDIDRESLVSDATPLILHFAVEIGLLEIKVKQVGHKLDQISQPQTDLLLLSHFKNLVDDLLVVDAEGGEVFQSVSHGHSVSEEVHQSVRFI